MFKNQRKITLKINKIVFFMAILTTHLVSHFYVNISWAIEPQTQQSEEATQTAKSNLCEKKLLGFHDELGLEFGIEGLEEKLTKAELNLGHGEHAEAFLHRLPDGTPVVRKVYFPDSLGQIRPDFVALKYLENERNHFPFKIAVAYEMGDTHLTMEFARGVNLESLMSNALAPEWLKEKLRKIYNEKLGRAIRFFEERCFDYQFRSQEVGFGKAKLQIPQALRASCDDGERFIEFIIKSDNIIVDVKTHDMTLIDPY